MCVQGPTRTRNSDGDHVSHTRRGRGSVVTVVVRGGRCVRVTGLAVIVTVIVDDGFRFVTMTGRFDFLHHGVETVFGMGRVLDHACGTVRFHQTVRPFDVAVSVAHFVLAFDVVRVYVFDAVPEMVRSGCVAVVVVIVTVLVVVVGVVVFVVSP